LKTLIPTDEELPDLRIEIVQRSETRIEKEEVKCAIWRMASNKAPELDEITGGVLRKSWPVVGEDLTRVLERCIMESVFPDYWKTTEVVVIRKGPEEDPSPPKSYRPVNLLSTISKVLKRLIVVRLKEEVKEKMSTDQHRFSIDEFTITTIRNCLEWVDRKREKLIVGVF